MKKVNLILFAGAIIFASASAFTTVKNNDSDTIYVDVEGTPTPYDQVADQGRCLESGPYCKFKLAADGVTQIPQDSQQHWEMN